MKTYRIEFRGLKDIDLTHMFECGQCFRWVPAEDGSSDYIGAAGGYAARACIFDAYADTDAINDSSIGSAKDSYDISSGTVGDASEAYVTDGRSVGDADGIDNTGGLTLRLDVTGGDEAFWREYFDLDTDYSAIKSALTVSDPAISEATRYGSGIRILRQDLFETIISFIISQNNNIPRIRKNIESICEAYGKPIGEAWGRMWHAFPEPEALAGADIDELNSMKLGYRSEYIKAAGQRFLEESQPESREEVLNYLGVGPKVANCIMLFGLRQTDAFPVDTWVKHIMNDMYGFDENDVRGMTDHAHERFGALAGYAQQYLFYYYRDRR